MQSATILEHHSPEVNIIMSMSALCRGGILCPLLFLSRTFQSKIHTMLSEVKFGKTGYRVKRLGFGAMRLPTHPDGKVNFDLSTPLIRYAIENGINFFDSHHFYHGGQSEEAIGRAIKDIPRENVILQTKIGMYHNYKEKECRQLLEKALKKFGTDYIDFYFTHSLNMKDYLKNNRLFLKFTDKALAQGLIKHRGFSVHDTPENTRKFILSGEFSAMLIQYNLIDRSNEEVISLASEKGLAVEVMGPVAGGLLSIRNDKLIESSPVRAASTAELALKYVLANPDVDVAVSGMSAIQQVKENIATVSGPDRFSGKEARMLNETLENRKKLLELYCTGCQYCMPCPHKVNIPVIFRFYNMAKVYGFTERAGTNYGGLKPEEKASMCKNCGKCEPKCPQKIPIRKKLREAKSYFE